MTVKYGNTDDPTDEMEVRKMLLYSVDKLAACIQYNSYSLTAILPLLMILQLLFLLTVLLSFTD